MGRKHAVRREVRCKNCRKGWDYVAIKGSNLPLICPKCRVIGKIVLEHETDLGEY
jgi:phage FluMu protein Com